MTELVIVLMALTNAGLILAGGSESYVPSLRSRLVFIGSAPVGLLTITALIVIGGPVVLSLIAGLIALANILLTILLVADGPGGG